MNEIPSIINLATNASLNDKTNEVKGEIPSITNLVTTAALTSAENNISKLVIRRLQSRKQNMMQNYQKWKKILTATSK